MNERRSSEPGLNTPEWMSSLREISNSTKSGGEISSSSIQSALEIKQIANQGDIVTIEELLSSQMVIDTVSLMPEKLRNGIIDNKIICKHDYAGNPSIELVPSEKE